MKPVDSRISLDLRITYICAHCGGFAELSFWAIEVFDSGTTLTCDKCGERTIVLLLKPDIYADLVAHEVSKRKDTVFCELCGQKAPGNLLREITIQGITYLACECCWSYGPRWYEQQDSREDETSL